jgi:hypothetical protein
VLFLIPIYGRRPLSARATGSWPQGERARRQAFAVLALLAVIPIGVFALLPPLTQPATADLETNDLYVPANQFPLGAGAAAGAVSLRWPRQKTDGTRADYAIFRSNSDGLFCMPVAHASTRCSFETNPVATVPSSATSFVDHPGAGRWSYRVALQASAYGPLADGNTLLLSAPVSVTLRR